MPKSTVPSPASIAVPPLPPVNPPFPPFPPIALPFIVVSTSEPLIAQPPSPASAPFEFPPLPPFILTSSPISAVPAPVN